MFCKDLLQALPKPVCGLHVLCFSGSAEEPLIAPRFGFLQSSEISARRSGEVLDHLRRIICISCISAKLLHSFSREPSSHPVPPVSRWRFWLPEQQLPSSAFLPTRGRLRALFTAARRRAAVARASGPLSRRPRFL
jgi:hypothetical protein